MIHAMPDAHIARTLEASLTPLPREEWFAKRLDENHIIVGMHTRFGAIKWTKFENSDLPNDLVGRNDLERALANYLDVTSI
jgi:hypothetical protein